MPREIHTYTLPDYWASYLINGDASGIEDEERAQADAFLKDNNLPAPCEVSEESYFTHGHDANRNQGANVLVYTFLIITPPDPEEQAELRANFKPIGGIALCNFGGIELMFDRSGDAVIYRYNYGQEDIDKEEIYIAEIEFEDRESEDEDEDENAREYFMSGTMKVYLDECTRF
jgi:hypothetical protein